MAVEDANSDQFPVGMRVLAVDDDPICLKLLDTLLRKCQYQVITTNQAIEALKMLRENRNKFDLVISDVNMPHMDGFKLLELVILEMDLPVIMLSAHSDTKLVMKAVTHGACDYLVKPVRIEELKNIWQHVIRRKNSDDRDQNKEPFWSVEQHRKFVPTVNQLGLDKAVPKKTLVTRENIAGHLQKYRFYLKKMTQQASTVAAPDNADSYNRIGLLDGYGDFCTSSASGKIGSSTLPSYAASDGIFSKLNSPAGLSSRGISFSALLYLVIIVISAYFIFSLFRYNCFGYFEKQL